MSDSRKLEHVLEDATTAAAGGDYQTAERRLREAANLQESSLGSVHPDLANTLNNVGVVCERLGKPEEAELAYRRAFAIATAALDSSHEFVATSRKNLQEFYTSRGRHAEAAALDLSAGARRAARAEGPATPPRDERIGPRAAARPPSARVGRLALAGLAGVALLTLAWVGGQALWPAGSTELKEQAGRTLESLPGGPEPTMAAGHAADERAATVSAPPAPAPTAAPDGLASSRPPRGAEPGPATSAAGARRPAPTARSTRAEADGDTTRAAVTPVATGATDVVTAQLCRTLSTSTEGGGWRCDPASDPEDAGTLYFYTRLRTPSATTVQHRWYRDEVLQRTVSLTIRTNAREGYRTYSSQRVGRDEAGEWRVELRNASGDLLHEARVHVR